MGKTEAINFRIGSELKARMDKEIAKLGTDKTKWLITVIQKALEEKIVIQRKGEKEVVDNPVKVTPADIQKRLDELYKHKKVLGNGVEMSGTYVDIYNHGPGDVIQK